MAARVHSSAGDDSSIEPRRPVMLEPAGPEAGSPPVQRDAATSDHKSTAPDPAVRLGP